MNSFVETLNGWGNQFVGFAWPMFWQSSLLIAALFAFDFALRRKVRAAIRHALWLIVLVKLLLPPSLALPTSAAWWLRASPQPVVKTGATPYVITYGSETPPRVFSFPLQPTPPPIRPKISFPAWLFLASLAISVGLLAWLLIRWQQINRKVQRAKDPGWLTPILDEARRLAQSHSGIRLKLAEDSTSPAVFGLFRPAVLLPQSLIEKLSVEQLRAVMLHELVHLRRGDVWVNCAQALLQIIYWWHPLLWLANARIRRVREEAVDDAVMLVLRDGADIYAPTLLEVAKFAFHRPLASLGLVGILESRSALRQRIERLMDFRPPRKAGPSVAAVLGILAFSAVALPMGQAPEKANPDTISLKKAAIPTPRTNATTVKNHAGELVWDAKRLYEMGRFYEAAAMLKAVIAVNPDNQAAYYYLDLVEKSLAAEKARAMESPRGPRIDPPNHSNPWDDIPTDFDASSTHIQTNLVTDAGREIIYRKLNQIRIDSIPWTNGVTLSEALGFLQKQSKLQDPEGKGINFLFNPTTQAGGTLDPNAIHIKMAEKNVRLADVLDAIEFVADTPIEYTVKDYGVVFSSRPSRPEPPTLEMRVFKVDPFTLGNSVHFDLANTKRTPDESLAALQEYFKSIGVDLTTPGRSIAWNNRLALLFVKATPSELDTIERAIQALNQSAPQIHIKAYFIEVPEQVLSTTRKMLANKGVEQTNGVLTAPYFHLFLHQLEHCNSSEMLTEPEVVTTSGRQTQMRATESVNVVTNFTLEETSSNSTAVIPQSENMQTGPMVDVVPYLLSDGYTIYLWVTASRLQFFGYAESTNFTHFATNAAGQKIRLPIALPAAELSRASTGRNLFDGQGMVLFPRSSQVLFLQTDSKRAKRVAEHIRQAERKEGEKSLAVFITATVVDPAGNRVYSDNNPPFDPSTIPPQPH